MDTPFIDIPIKVLIVILFLLFVNFVVETKGCLPNRDVCHVEYIDGTDDYVPCWDARIDKSIFGSATILRIRYRGGKTEIPLSAVKRWRVEKEGGVK